MKSLSDKIDIYIGDDDLKWLRSNGAKVQVVAPDAVRYLLSSCVYQPALYLNEVEYYMDRNIIAPNPQLEYVPIPGGVLRHDEIRINGTLVSDIVIKSIQNNNNNEIFIVPAIYGKTGCISLPQFSYDFFYHMFTGNLTLPMSACSPIGGWCLAWDEDLDYSFIVRKKESRAMDDLFYDKLYYIEMFSKIYPKIIPDDGRHLLLMNKYIFPK